VEKMNASLTMPCTVPTREERYKPIHDFFRQQGFLPVDAESFQVFKQYERHSALAEMSAVMITTWTSDFHGLYKIMGGYLCSVYFHHTRSVYFVIYPPVEEAACPLERIVDTLYDLTNKAGYPLFQLRFIDEPFLRELRTLKGYSIKTECSDNESEYIYHPYDILDTNGSINAEKRRLIKKCANTIMTENFSLQALTNKNVHHCYAVENEWCQNKDCRLCASYWGCEKKALEVMISLFDERIQKGLILFQGEKPAGYVIGECRDKNLAYLWYGKSALNNFFIYLIYTMVDRYFASVDYINASEDMGNPGLRLFKSHLGVHTFLQKYTCTFTALRGQK
jgi:hypothetical protein